MLRLVLPTAKYKKSFLDGFTQESQYIDWTKEAVNKDFQGLIERLRGRSFGLYLPSGFVPDTYYWLVAGDEYIGTLTIRHRLNRHLMRIGGNIGYMIRPDKRGRGYGKEILRLGLKKAKAMDFKKVLITVDEDNIPSRKVIEANGGVLKNVVDQGNNLPKKMRFWIKL